MLLLSIDNCAIGYVIKYTILLPSTPNADLNSSNSWGYQEVRRCLAALCTESLIDSFSVRCIVQYQVSLSQSDHFNSPIDYLKAFCSYVCICALIMKENSYLASAMTKPGRQNNPDLTVRSDTALCVAVPRSYPATYMLRSVF